MARKYLQANMPFGQRIARRSSIANARHLRHTTTTTTEKIDPDTNRQQPTGAEVDCFICGRPVAGNNSSFEADNYGRQAISQASICNRCLEDKNAYQNYQHAFLEKVHKVAKVKL